MMKKIAVIALLTLFVLAPIEALACACCANAGDYYTRSNRPDATEIELLGELKFDEAATLAMGEADFEEAVRGLGSVKKDFEMFDFANNNPFFMLGGGFKSRRWNFNFKTASGKTGSISLPLPAKIEHFGADIHDTPAGQEVQLYKEMRFRGNVGGGTGFFASGLKRPAAYTLILQGRGNYCPAAESFTNWRLDVEGLTASYVFFGKFKH